MESKMTPERIGWLISCKSPANVSKGMKALRVLTTKDQRMAKKHASTLATLYKDRGRYETQTRLNSHPNMEQIQ